MMKEGSVLGESDQKQAAACGASEQALSSRTGGLRTTSQSLARCFAKEARQYIKYLVITDLVLLSLEVRCEQHGEES